MSVLIHISYHGFFFSIHYFWFGLKKCQTKKWGEPIIMSQKPRNAFGFHWIKKQSAAWRLNTKVPCFETRLGPFCSVSLNLPVGVNAPGWTSPNVSCTVWTHLRSCFVSNLAKIVTNKTLQLQTVIASINQLIVSAPFGFLAEEMSSLNMFTSLGNRTAAARSVSKPLIRWHQLTKLYN